MRSCGENEAWPESMSKEAKITSFPGQHKTLRDHECLRTREHESAGNGVLPSVQPSPYTRRNGSCYKTDIAAKSKHH